MKRINISHVFFEIMLPIIGKNIYTNNWKSILQLIILYDLLYFIFKLARKQIGTHKLN